MNKFRAKKTIVDEIAFDSKAEARHYSRLKLLERAGQISDLKLQVVFELAPSVRVAGRKRPPIKYIADFTYIENGELVVCDVKGMITPVYSLKRHLMMAVHGLDILEVS
tara:strand:- start:654 stop:980 length:327 start_codon:yes stop_codon:yes gene_type:complete